MCFDCLALTITKSASLKSCLVPSSVLLPQSINSGICSTRMELLDLCALCFAFQAKTSEITSIFDVVPLPVSSPQNAILTGTSSCLLNFFGITQNLRFCAAILPRIVCADVLSASYCETNPTHIEISNLKKDVIIILHFSSNVNIIFVIFIFFTNCML